MTTNTTTPYHHPAMVRDEYPIGGSNHPTSIAYNISASGRNDSHAITRVVEFDGNIGLSTSSDLSEELNGYLMHKTPYS